MLPSFVLTLALIQGAPVKVAVPGANVGEVTLLGVEAIDDPECEGVVAKELSLWNIATKIVEDSRIPSTNGVYVVTRDGSTLNEIAAWTGCVRVKSARFDREVEIRSAWRTAQVLQRGHYKARFATANEIATTAKTAEPAGGYGGGPNQWSGNGSKDTESFEMSGEWRVAWSATPTSTVGGILSISVQESATGRIVNTISSGRIQSAAQDSSVVRTPPGRYYLSISGANVSWRVAITR